jgi:hypothetical protein
VNVNSEGVVDHVQLGPDAFRFDLASLLRHAFGHVLGLDHSHPTACAAERCTDRDDYQRHSIMRATWCSDWLTARSYPTQIDGDVASRSYGGPPAVVMVDGAPVGRALRTGELHRWAGNEWRQIGGPTTMFSVRDDTIYRVLADGSVESFGGEAWTKIGEGAAQVLACSSATCQTNDSDGSAWRFTGSWQRIGGPAVRYASTANTLYRLTFSNRLERYDGAQNAWEYLASLSGVLTTGSNRVLVYDPHGADDGEIRGRLYVYEESSAAWSVLPLDARGVAMLDQGYAYNALDGGGVQLEFGNDAIYPSGPSRLSGAGTLFLIDDQAKVWQYDHAAANFIDLGVPVPALPSE